MTRYEQKISLLRQASGKHSGMAIWRVLLAAVLLGIVVLALGVLEYRQKETGIPQPSPTCCVQPMDPPRSPYQ
jgi:hypothetical protein